MINILVTLEVKDFDKLAIFESMAAKIMHSYGGCIVRAFETFREGLSGQEIHVLEFPNEAAFAEYRSDSRLIEHAELREDAIKSMTVMTSSTVKNYSRFKTL